MPRPPIDGPADRHASTMQIVLPGRAPSSHPAHAIRTTREDALPRRPGSGLNNRDDRASSQRLAPQSRIRPDPGRSVALSSPSACSAAVRRVHRTVAAAGSPPRSGACGRATVIPVHHPAPTARNRCRCHESVVDSPFTEYRRKPDLTSDRRERGRSGSVRKDRPLLLPGSSSQTRQARLRADSSDPASGKSSAILPT